MSTVITLKNWGANSATWTRRVVFPADSFDFYVGISTWNTLPAGCRLKPLLTKKPASFDAFMQEWASLGGEVSVGFVNGGENSQVWCLDADGYVQLALDIYNNPFHVLRLSLAHSASE